MPEDFVADLAGSEKEEEKEAVNGERKQSAGKEFDLSKDAAKNDPGKVGAKTYPRKAAYATKYVPKEEKSGVVNSSYDKAESVEPFGKLL